MQAPGRIAVNPTTRFLAEGNAELVYAHEYFMPTCFDAPQALDYLAYLRPYFAPWPYFFMSEST